MIRCIRTNRSDKAFISLIKQLDEELLDRYPELQVQYLAHHQLEADIAAVVAYEGEHPIACGCFAQYDADTVEMKRFYVQHGYRDKGFAIAVLHELEAWAAEKGFHKAILETGMRQPEAISLYRKNGYRMIDNYGPYVDISESICMEKELA